MSSVNLDAIIARYPRERKSISRLGRLLASQEAKGSAYTLGRLYDLGRSSSVEVCALVMAEFAHQGVVEIVVRTESPATQGGIGDYDSIEKVPRVIRDWRTDRDVEIGPDNLRVIYKVPSGEQSG